MTAVLWVSLILGLLVLVGAFGPVLLHKAAPALTRAPRLAIALLAGGVLVWPAALMAVGPVLAWILSGPSVLPFGAADVCRRCLVAANPFQAAALETQIPSALLIAVPLAVGLVFAAGIAADHVARAGLARETAGAVLEGSTRRTIHGHAVSVVADDRAWALAFPSCHGGIAVSSGALERLEDDELAVVLAHEAAHLRQRHHFLSDLVASTAAHLHRVPLAREASEALPAYLEIAADDRARRQVGTTALVRALLVLGDRPVPDAGALHAAGPERIPHLVRPATGRRGYLTAAAATVQLAVLGAGIGAVFFSYVIAVLTGCV